MLKYVDIIFHILNVSVFKKQILYMGRYLIGWGLKMRFISNIMY